MGKLLIGAATDAGRVRDHNEDEVFLAELDSERTAARGFLCALADGMGGHERGEVASKLAIEALVERFYAEDGAAGGDMVTTLQLGFRRANERILEESINGGSGGGSMGTTMVAAAIVGSHLTVANVGDSRAYLIRAEQATQITRDHSLVAEQVAGGVLTDEEARNSDYRNIITRALGHRPKVEVDIFEIGLLPEDRILLCSDGVSGSVEPEELAAIVLRQEPQEASKTLIDLALDQGSTDNVTAAIVTYEPVVAAREAELAPAGAGERRINAILILLILVVIVAIIAGAAYALGFFG